MLYLLIFIPISLTLLPVITLSSGLVSDIEAGDLLYHIRHLSSDELQGRMSGTKGSERAARYIAESFEDSGLSPLGDGGTYFQKFPFITDVNPGEANSFVISSGDDSHSLKLQDDYYPLGFSSQGMMRGEMVFAGYGITAPELGYDDYEGMDVQDKVVLLLRYTPEGFDHEGPLHKYASLHYKTVNAKNNGARAVIFVTPTFQTEEGDLGDIGFDRSFLSSGVHAAVLRREAADRVLAGHGTSVSELEKISKERPNNSFSMPDTVSDIEVGLVYIESKGSNVLGFLEGASPALKNEVVIIGAHYDHIGLGGQGSRASGENSIHNGADDNASGTAGLLELARHFSANREMLQRSILFIAFSAEELGLLGSSYYVDNPRAPLNNTIAMINMDMIGRLDQKKLTILGTGSSPEWQELVEKANQGIGLDLSFNSSPFAPSDQSVFYTKKIPAIQFFTGLHEDYHTPGDDWEKINSYGQKLVTDLIANLLWELDASGERVAFSKAKESAGSFSKFKVYLGTIPDYSGSVEGVKLIGVREGSPAQKAGLMGEDVIVEYAGKEINNIYDYVYALQSSSPGVLADIVVIRNMERMSLRINPENR